MGKKRAPVFRDASAQENKREDSKINAIRTWDDIEHDSEDEFHESREKVLLDETEEYDDGEGSETEVYGIDAGYSDEEEEEEEDQQADKSDDDILDTGEQEEEYDDRAWGRNRKLYYNADQGRNLDEMKEEETEALRIQKERIATMDEADFMDNDVPGWGLRARDDTLDDKQLVESMNKDLEEISFDVSKSAARRRKDLPVTEKIKILQNESPELMDLLNEFKDKSQMIATLEILLERIQARGRTEDDEAKFIRFKHQLLLNYMTNVSFYFVLKASGLPDVSNHPVIEALVELRAALEKTEQAEEQMRSAIETFVQSLDAPVTVTEEVKELPSETERIPKKKKKSSKKKQSSPVITVSNGADVEEESRDNEPDVVDIEEEFKSLKKAAKKRKRTMEDDFGELEALDELDMEDKLRKKRSIRDYVTKIDAKQAKQQAKYQGDADIPYKERQIREKNGVEQPTDQSADLDDNDYDENDLVTAQGMRDEEDDDYYKEVAASKAAKKESKKAEYEATRPEIINDDVQVEDGQKRLASYKMLKNKGLTRHRKKEDRNTRVKHRKKYAKKLKKLSSVRQVVKPLTGTYGGEATGIKSNLVKSIKF